MHKYTYVKHPFKHNQQAFNYTQPHQDTRNTPQTSFRTRYTL